MTLRKTNIMVAPAPSPPPTDDFVAIPPPLLVDASGGQAAAAAEQYRREQAIVDTRLARTVAVAVKATALSDVCNQLRAETGIHLVAGRSVADEKVTVFCKEQPLRDVMRQLSRPFGYAWLRSGKEKEYRYELSQDLRSQLLEEELRSRDRHAALLALDQEMQRYRKYLNLSPDEARAAAAKASGEEKRRLERYAGDGWGPIQIYFRLSPNDLNRMRAGQSVTFTAERSRYSQPDEQPLPPDLARGILQSQDYRRIVVQEGQYRLLPVTATEGTLAAAVPDARALVTVKIEQSELGQFTYDGSPGVFISESSPTPGTFHVSGRGGGVAIGMSPSVLDPKNETANAKLAHHPALQRRVTVRPQPSCRLKPEPARGQAPETPRESEPRVTTADVLEALHRATGVPIVADFYTRLYVPRELSVQNRTLFDALNTLADRMRLRWSLGENGWLQLRSTSFFHDRLKEVPNRLLTRWAASRTEHGMLLLDDLVEIAQLTDDQLDASGMGEGARACFGLAKWVLPRVKHLRAELRFLAEFTPDQRRQAQTLAGLRFSRMTLAQQQGYLARAFRIGQPPRLDALGEATLHVDYTRPGSFRWAQPWSPWRPSPVLERTREAALLAARRIDPAAKEAQIEPTRLDLAFLYTWDPNGPVHLVSTTDTGWLRAAEAAR
jgi:hypothetical protein